MYGGTQGRGQEEKEETENPSSSSILVATAMFGRTSTAASMVALVSSF